MTNLTLNKMALISSSLLLMFSVFKVSSSVWPESYFGTTQKICGANMVWSKKNIEKNLIFKFKNSSYNYFFICKICPIFFAPDF